ncbi:MAG: alpha/beta hydrolase [Oscillospiraceae bacterium]
MKKIVNIIDKKFGSTLTCYLHNDGDDEVKNAQRPAMVIFPGGAYEIVSDTENECVSSAFFSKGFNTFVVKYSVKRKAKNMQPLKEAATAILMIRENAKEWEINPNQVVVCGFSAGGHLAGSIGILYKNKELLKSLNTEQSKIRPDAMVLCYPVVCTGEHIYKNAFYRLTGHGHYNSDYEKYSLEKFVDSDTPPAFIWHCVDDDCVDVENSMILMAELKKNNIPLEAHFFEKGGHGLSVCENYPHAAHWLTLCSEWIFERFSLL